jgi:hypothetical protein
MRIERLGLSRPGAISRASPLQRLGTLCYCGLEYNPAAAGSARESAQCLATALCASPGCGSPKTA